MHKPRKHLSAEDMAKIIAFEQSRVTIKEFCQSMNIDTSTYADVLRRHGLRGWRKETHKERLLREWRREQATLAP